jgi:hypothetical protein
MAAGSEESKFRAAKLRVEVAVMIPFLSKDSYVDLIT